MRVLTASEQTEYALAAQAVTIALHRLDNLPDWIRAGENIAVARARLQDWLDENEGRWVA